MSGRNRPTTQFVKIDGRFTGLVIQDGSKKSLIRTNRASGQGGGTEQDWYDNERLTPASGIGYTGAPSEEGAE